MTRDGFPRYIGRMNVTPYVGGRILQLDGLPFKPDDAVEVIVRFKKRRTEEQKTRYPLRGKVLAYEDPFDPMAADDWDVLR